MSPGDTLPPRTGDPREGSGASAEAAEAGAPWAWIEQLEHYAEAGLHAKGFVHDLANLLTALMGNCELGLLDEDAPALQGHLEHVLAQVQRIVERLRTFKTFVAPSHAGEATPLRLSQALDEAERFLAYPLRKVAPWSEEPEGEAPRPWIVRDLAGEPPSDVALAVPGPRMVHALVAALGAFVAPARRLRGALTVVARRLGPNVVVEVDCPEGIDPAEGDEYWHGGRTGLELQVATRMLAASKGRIERPHPTGPVRLVLPVDPAPDTDTEPSPPHDESTRSYRAKTWRPPGDAWDRHP